MNFFNRFSMNNSIPTEPPPTERTDLYECLGVNPSASQEEIKRAFRIASLKYHPDKNPGDKDSLSKFQLISESYSILSDENKRKLYDIYANAKINMQFKSGNGGGPYGYGADKISKHKNINPNDFINKKYENTANMNDIFSQFFNQMSPNAGGAGVFMGINPNMFMNEGGGNDIPIITELNGNDIQDILNELMGNEHILNNILQSSSLNAILSQTNNQSHHNHNQHYNHQQIEKEKIPYNSIEQRNKQHINTPLSNTSHSIAPNTVPTPSPSNTHIYSKPESIVMHLEISMDDVYSGTQIPIQVERWILNPNTNNRTFERETLYVKVYKGIDDGEIITIPDKGHIITNCSNGDIKVVIKVINTTELKRKGLDLLYGKHITLKEALCGDFEFEMKLLDGNSCTIKNKTGSIIEPNFRKTYPQMGLTRGDQTGNLIICFIIDFPTQLTDEQIQQIKNIL